MSHIEILRPYQSITEAVSTNKHQKPDRMKKAPRTLTTRQRRSLSRQIVDVSDIVAQQIVPGRSGITIDGNEDLRKLASDNGIDVEGSKPVLARRDLQDALNRGAVVLFDAYATPAIAPSYRNGAKK